MSNFLPFNKTYSTRLKNHTLNQDVQQVANANTSLLLDPLLVVEVEEVVETEEMGEMVTTVVVVTIMAMRAMETMMMVLTMTEPLQILMDTMCVSLLHQCQPHQLLILVTSLVLFPKELTLGSFLC